jgi:cytochrome c-type biogenesis protein CcmH
MPNANRALLVLFCAAVLIALVAPALAVQPDEMLPDPRLEQRARAISQQLRCMVCQNQSIDDSDAPLAKDLRLLVRERLKAGDSDPQIINYMVARYGEFVLLKPRLSWQTVALWLTPAIVLLADRPASQARPLGCGRPSAADARRRTEARRIGQSGKPLTARPQRISGLHAQTRGRQTLRGAADGADQGDA